MFIDGAFFCCRDVKKEKQGRHILLTSRDQRSRKTTVPTPITESTPPPEWCHVAAPFPRPQTAGRSQSCPPTGTRGEVCLPRPPGNEWEDPIDDHANPTPSSSDVFLSHDKIVSLLGSVFLNLFSPFFRVSDKTHLKEVFFFAPEGEWSFFQERKV